MVTILFIFVSTNKYKEIIKQNPIYGFQKPQKYCLIPGFMETTKANVTGELTNNTCDVS